MFYYGLAKKIRKQVVTGASLIVFFIGCIYDYDSTKIIL